MMRKGGVTEAGGSGGEGIGLWYGPKSQIRRIPPLVFPWRGVVSIMSGLILPTPRPAPTMTPQPSTPPSAVAWIIDLVVARVVVLPSGESIDRDGFYEWLWGEWGEDGLAGVFEGTVDAPEAVALGFEPTARVLDAATPPADRDWVARLPQATAAVWFADEPAAMSAAAVLAAVVGCDVRGVRGSQQSVGDDEWRRYQRRRYDNFHRARGRIRHWPPRDHATLPCGPDGLAAGRGAARPSARFR